MLLGPLFFGTVKYKVFVPFWGFVTWTPPGLCPTPVEEITASPGPQLCVEGTTEYPSPPVEGGGGGGGDF